ncbi:uncharacterized protein LOC124530764 [Vanessa cardui]|uniref:uncharacterized protein LOC124530764 n=1 Tax=Vanessa cardui TaxID=171605 RepID=UPI001F140B9E|nr:uncharacterized protein LOC124530764 [Vanessa cardui]
MVSLSLFMTVFCLRISVMYSAPLHLQLLQPYQSLMQPQEQNIQQQLMELQAIQQLNQMSGRIALNNPLPPLLFFLPEHQANMNVEEKQDTNNNIDHELKLRDYNTKSNDKDSDSVVINAKPIPIIEEQKAILMLPNGRFSIGDFISAIPFLPIEINVPDTISWAYNGIANGISGIISIIGQRLPFQRPSMDASTKGISLKSLLNNLQIKNERENILRPINMMMPLNGFNRPILPVQL